MHEDHAEQVAGYLSAFLLRQRIGEAAARLPPSAFQGLLTAACRTLACMYCGLCGSSHGRKQACQVMPCFTCGAAISGCLDWQLWASGHEGI